MAVFGCASGTEVVAETVVLGDPFFRDLAEVGLDETSPSPPDFDFTPVTPPVSDSEESAAEVDLPPPGAPPSVGPASLVDCAPPPLGVSATACAHAGPNNTAAARPAETVKPMR
jgi:hypothetical protein